MHIDSFSGSFLLHQQILAMTGEMPRLQYTLEQHFSFWLVCSVKQRKTKTYLGDWLKASLYPDNAWILIFAHWNYGASSVEMEASVALKTAVKNNFPVLQERQLMDH